MKIVSKIGLAAILLSISSAIVAAQAPVQEPIPELQWQPTGLAFLAGFHQRLGAGSIVSQLAPCVAKDIVMLLKPQETYGFIQNFTDKPIVYFSLGDPKNPYSAACIIARFIDWGDVGNKGLGPQNQYRFIINGECGIIGMNGICEQVWPQTENGLFNIFIQFDGEDRLIIKNVHCFDLMNIKVYREGQRVRLEVTTPDQTPVNYYAEAIQSKRR